MIRYPDEVRRAIGSVRGPGEPGLLGHIETMADVICRRGARAVSLRELRDAARRMLETANRHSGSRLFNDCKVALSEDMPDECWEFTATGVAFGRPNYPEPHTASVIFSCALGWCSAETADRWARLSRDERAEYVRACCETQID